MMINFISPFEQEQQDLREMESAVRMVRERSKSREIGLRSLRRFEYFGLMG